MTTGIQKLRGSFGVYALLVATLLLPATVLASQQAEAMPGETKFLMYGTANDFITLGEDLSFSESATTTFSTRVEGNLLAVRVERSDAQGGVSWDVEFAAPDGDSLAEGDRFLATRYPFQEPGTAGMSVSGDARGCNQLYGEFAVQELELDAGGQVESLAIDFRQSCDNGPAAVGGVRVNSTVGDPARDFRVSPVPTGETSFTLHGEVGEFISNGEDVAVVADPDGFVVISATTNGNVLNVSVTDDTDILPEFWTMDFAAPGGVPLAAGDEFIDAVRYPFNEADQAGFDLSGNARGCNELTAQFRVLELSINMLNRVETFAADFLQSCDGAAAITGGIRFNSEIPPPEPYFSLTPNLRPALIVQATATTFAVDELVTIVYNIDNSAGAAVTALTFADLLPAGLEATRFGNDCGGEVQAFLDGVVLTGGVLGAGERCAVLLEVRGVAEGVYTTRASRLQSSVGSLRPIQVALTVGPPPFADIRGGQYYSQAVAWAVANGITNGTSRTTFSPNAFVTRAQMATFLWRYAGEPIAGQHGFVDVPDGTFYSEAVAFLAEEGITTGTSATTFSPLQFVSRAQMATFLWRFQGEPAAPPHAFLDVPPGSYYEAAVEWMSARGITTGTSATTYSPNSALTRAQAVTFLWRMNRIPGLARSHDAAPESPNMQPVQGTTAPDDWQLGN